MHELGTNPWLPVGLYRISRCRVNGNNRAGTNALRTNGHGSSGTAVVARLEATRRLSGKSRILVLDCVPHPMADHVDQTLRGIRIHNDGVQVTRRDQGVNPNASPAVTFRSLLKNPT